MSSYFTWDDDLVDGGLIMTLTTADVDVWEKETEIIFTATDNGNQVSVHTITVIARNCMHEPIGGIDDLTPFLPTMDNHYVLIGETFTDTLSETAWVSA